MHWCVVCQRIKKGTIDAPIGIKNGSLKRSIHSSKMAKPAVTEYAVVKNIKMRDETAMAIKSSIPY